MANQSLTKLLTKTTEPFKVILGTPDTFKVEEKEIHSTVSMGRVTMAPGNAARNDGTRQNHCIPGMEHDRNEDAID